MPLGAAGAGVIEGPAMLAGVAGTQPADLDSHFRYLSGIFLAIGIGFASCVPRIERKAGRFRLLGALVVAGGLARLASLAVAGAPSTPHLFGLGMELGVVPLLIAWQGRVAKRYSAAAQPASSVSSAAGSGIGTGPKR